MTAVKTFSVAEMTSKGFQGHQHCSISHACDCFSYFIEITVCDDVLFARFSPTFVQNANIYIVFCT